MITSGQAQAGTASGLLCNIPPGPCTVILSNAGTAATVWAGMTGTVVAGQGTASNGFPLPSGVPIAIPVYKGSSGGVLNCVTQSGTASVGWMVSTAYGQTGP